MEERAVYLIKATGVKFPELWWDCDGDAWVDDEDEATHFVRERDAQGVAKRVSKAATHIVRHVIAPAQPVTSGEQYKADCLRTEYTPDFVRLKHKEPVTDEAAHNRTVARLLHAVLGLMSEVGEIADALKKHIIYGKELDLVNLVEEIGDESWYMSLLLDAIGSGWEEAWTKNINKLKARYPDKFTREQALNRDLDAERAVLEGKPPAVLDSLAFHDEGNGAPELYNGTVEDIVAALKEDFDQRMRRAEMESDGIDEYLVGENNDSYFGKIDVGWRAILREGIAKLLKELKGSEK